MDSRFEIFIIKKYFSLLHQGHPEVKFVVFFFFNCECNDEEYDGN